MKSLQIKLKAIGDALAEVTPNCYHYYRPKMEPPFIVWAEDSEPSSLQADNRKAEQAVSGWVDYFTLTEYDATVDSIQEKLNSLPIGWRLDSVDYEEETNLIHYSWIFEVS